MILKGLSHFLLGTLRGRLILGVAAVHAVMMALFIADLTARQRAMLLDRQIEEAAALSESLATSAAEWIAADDISGLQELVEAQRRYPEILFAILADREGRVLADTDKSRQGQYLLDLPDEVRQAVLSETPALVDVAAPAMIGGRHVGWVRIGIGQRAAGEKLAQITRSGVVYALAAVLIGSVIAWLMGRRITRRLYAVQETIDAVRSGNRLARSSLAGADEAAIMAREFNAMLDALAERDVELRTSEERYRSLIHKVQTAILLHDGQGRILNSNPMAQALLGLSADQLLGKALIDPKWHFRREDGSVLPVAEYPASLVLSSRQPLRGQVTGISRPQRDDVAWVLVNAEPEYDDAGEIALVIVSFVDITERKLAEEALQRLNRELRAISNCNQALMRAVDEQTLLEDICHIICDEAGYRMAWVGYAEKDDAKTLRPVAWAGAEDGYLEQAGLTWADTERGRGPSGTAIRSGESACIQDFTTAPQAAPWRDHALQRGYRSSIALPLRDEEAITFGVLCIYSSKPDAFTADEIRLMEELAGDLAFGIMVLRDRIERKRAEEALYEAQQVFRVLVENSPDIIARYDRDCRRTYVNPTYLKVAQIPPQELLAATPLQRSPLPAASAVVLQNLLRRVLDSGVAEAIDVLWPKADHIDDWYNIYAFPELDREGRVVSVMTVSRDISERKRFEAALRDRESMYRSLVTAMAEGVVFQDAGGVITAANPRAEQMLGLSAKQLLGQTSEDRAPMTIAEDGSPFPAELHPAMVTLRTGEPQANVVMGVRKPDGMLSWLSTNSQPLTAAGALKPYAVVTTFHDITEHKRFEQELKRLNTTLEQRVQEELAKNRQKDHLLIQQSRLAAMGDMMHNIAHQWRQPLAALSLILANIKDEYDFRELTPESLGEAVKRSHRLLKSMSDTIDDFRDFFRPDQSAEEFEISQAVEHALSIIEASIKDHRIEVVKSLPPGLKAFGYPNQFSQAVLNILANANEAIQQHGIPDGRIEIRLESTDDTGKLTIEDNGGGIPEDLLPKVFDPYFTTKDQGTGIGLYMTKMIVERHLKGKVSISNGSSGTLVTILMALSKPRLTEAQSKRTA